MLVFSRIARLLFLLVFRRCVVRKYPKRRHVRVRYNAGRDIHYRPFVQVQLGDLG